MLPDDLKRLAEKSASLYSLPAGLVIAIAIVESAGDPYAWRVEPDYRWLWDIRMKRPFRKLTQAERVSEKAPADFPHFRFSSVHTEWWGQQASWGMMQVMGGLAREYGFALPFPQLCDPAVNLDIACRFLNSLRSRFLASHGWHGVAAAYNAGKPRYDDAGNFQNADYVNKVAKQGGFQKTIFPGAGGIA